MFRSRSSALVVLAACGGGPLAPAAPSPPRCDEPVVLASQDEIVRFGACTTAAAVTIRTGAPLDLRPLAALASIHGDLVVGPTLALDDLSFRGLREVGGAIRIASNGSIRGVFFPQLERAGSVTIAANAAATTISAPRLREVGATLAITGHGSLEIVDLTVLVAIGEDLVIADNPVLTRVDIAQLAKVRTVRVEGNRALGELQTGVPTPGGRDHE